MEEGERRRMTVSLTLNRVTFAPDCPTYGVLLSQGFPLCVTLELPWKDNAHDVSCIPPGDYRVTKFNSPSKGPVFLLHDVPNRSMVEMHVANTVNDLLGCIGVGRAFFSGGITTSKPTLQELYETLPDEFTMTINNPN